MDGYLICPERSREDPAAREESLSAPLLPTSPEFALQIREGHEGHIREASLGSEQPVGAGHGALLLVGWPRASQDPMFAGEREKEGAGCSRHRQGKVTDTWHLI